MAVMYSEHFCGGFRIGWLGVDNNFQGFYEGGICMGVY